ncbi:RDD family protein [Microbacterium dauci]|uniref:RDD family protein n=1 Tax=Microbacterium dauci TaxID=3048008 RepID=A0ABT6ZCL5_9MICO|nr:RDD family protein [Microbacterium sp. LX3-4]MDJ1113879.1 RDD family protein [Microbacterium sp. LX3-4]
MAAPAALRHRVLAAAIDAGIAAAVVAVASGLVVAVSVIFSGAVAFAAAVAVAGLAGLAWFLVQTWMQGNQGSIGMRLMGIRLAHAGDGWDLGFGRALGRNVVWSLGCSIIVGWFSPLFDRSPQRRGWHDLASGAVMTDAVPTRPARDEVSARSAGPARPSSPTIPVADAASIASIRDALQGARVVPDHGAAKPPAPVASPATDLPVPVVVAASVAPVAQAAAPAVPAESAAAAQPAAAAPLAPAAAPLAPAAAPLAPAAAPVAPPASWAPPARTPNRAPRTLPVDVIETVPGAPGRSGIRPTDPATPLPTTLAMLVWDDGTRHTVYDATLFGRSPAGEAGKRLTPVRDDTLSISKTHFEIGADEQSAWIVDRHSLNGVVITRAGVPQRIVPGEPARLWPGDVLDIGDRRVTVEGAR